MKILVYLITFLLLCGKYVLGLPMPQEEEADGPPPGVLPEGLSLDDLPPGFNISDMSSFTTPQMDSTDIPQSLVDEAMNHDVGRFTPMVQEFQYHNEQDLLQMASPNRIYEMPCLPQFLRCIRNLVAQQRTCGFNSKEDSFFGYHYARNICEIHFENCRRGYRAWRTIGYGNCFVTEEGVMLYFVTD